MARSRWRATAAFVLLAAGCGSTGMDRIPPAASLDPGPPGPAVTTVPGAGAIEAPTTAAPSAHGLGEQVQIDGDTSVAALAVDAGYAAERLAVEVELCSATGTQPSPLEFELVLDDGARAAPVPEGKPPAFGGTDPGPGDCTTGWLTFAVPEGRSATHLRFRADPPVEWSVG